MRRCAGCGGVLGRDCWNEPDCVWISQDMAQRASAQQQPEPCQGCSMVTGGYVPHIGVCDGLTCDADVVARAAAWRSMLTTTAPPTPSGIQDLRDRWLAGPGPNPRWINELTAALAETATQDGELIERLRDEQSARCLYGTREGDGRTCDCKFGAPTFGVGGEMSGCPELRTAIWTLTGERVIETAAPVPVPQQAPTTEEAAG
jgi:hypothetical protein